jgi:uncharacterized membrane protein YccC
MPAMFAVGEKLVGNPTVATFAAFGSFAMLLLVDFGGPMRQRLQAQAALVLGGGVLVVLGTLASRSAWLGALAMAIVGFCVLFAGVVSSVLASAAVALLLAFILPVSIAGPISAIPDRLAGWGLAAGPAFLAVALLWPAPVRDPLRDAAVAACRALAARLRSDVGYALCGDGAPSEAGHDEAIANANAAVSALHRTFFATPYRPTGLSTVARTLVRLVDELGWVNAVVVQTPAQVDGSPGNRAACAVKSASASVLELGADLLERPGGQAEAMCEALAELRATLVEVERTVMLAQPLRAMSGDSPPSGDEQQITEFVTSLDPSFRAQELSFAVSLIAANIDLTEAAERRNWFDRLRGRQPSGLVGPLSAAQERAAGHVERHSVWLHNSVRGGIGLGLAVFIADRLGVQHSFWVVLGTLSVLRSSALNTGQSIVRGLLGTVVGFVVGAGLLALIGTSTTLLWLLLPPAVLVAGFAPAAISFAAGQAAFTLTIVVLFNIVQPAGWRVGLVRIEDVAIGCVVSLVVGLLFWPRGAAVAFGQALDRAYNDSAHYLAAAVGFGLGRCDLGTPARPAPSVEAIRAAASARRLDDAFRGYLAERGPKPVPLSEVTSLITGVAGLRLAAEAVLDLWRRDPGGADGDRAAARRELLAATEAVAGWYEDFGAGLGGRAEVPQPLAKDPLSDDRLVDAVRHDLHDADGRANALAVRMIWTGDHLDAARRLQGGLVGPARAAAEPHPLTHAFRPLPPWHILRTATARRA